MPRYTVDLDATEEARLIKVVGKSSVTKRQWMGDVVRKALADEKYLPVPKNPVGVLAMVPEGYYTRKQAAELVGRSVDRLRALDHAGTLPPSKRMHVGSLEVALYNDDDVQKLKRYFANVRFGRPPRASVA